MPEPREQISVDEFAEKLKSKYPQYQDMDNFELTESIVEKHPKYLRGIYTPDYIERQSIRDNQKGFSGKSPLERGLIGTGKGMLDVIEGGKQLIGFGDEGYAREQELYEQYAKGDP